MMAANGSGRATGRESVCRERRARRGFWNQETLWIDVVGACGVAGVSRSLGRQWVGPGVVVDEALHARLADLLRRYDVNDYAASLKVFASKPR